MRMMCETMREIENIGPYQETYAGRSMARQYIDTVRPELVLMLLDMGNQMTDAVDRINTMVKAAGFDSLEDALAVIGRIGKAMNDRG